MAEKLKFPLDLGDYYNGKVNFTIASSKETGTSNTNTPKPPPLLSRNPTPTEASNPQPSLSGFGVDINEFTGNKLGRSSTAKSNRTVSGDGVTLYLPTGLAFTDGVQFGETDLAISGGFAEQGESLFKTLAEDNQSFIEGLKGDVSSQSGPLAKLIGAEAAKLNLLKLAGAQAAAQVQAGVTINPNTRVLFKRVNLRQFSFSFKLIGKSPEETAEIEKIVRFFRTQLYPETFSVQDVGVGYKFPDKFDIKISYEGSEGTWNPPKIKACYLRDVTTTYNASSMAFHKDGKPVEVDLGLSFMESAALERADIEEGF